MPLNFAKGYRESPYGSLLWVLLFAGGFKGYGLAMMVEVLCGILADAAFGPNVRKWKGDDRVANLVSRGTLFTFTRIVLQNDK